MSGARGAPEFVALWGSTEPDGTPRWLFAMTRAGQVFTDLGDADPVTPANWQLCVRAPGDPARNRAPQPGPSATWPDGSPAVGDPEHARARVLAELGADATDFLAHYPAVTFMDFLRFLVVQSEEGRTPSTHDAWNMAADFIADQMAQARAVDPRDQRH